MTHFADLADRCTAFLLRALREVGEKTLDELQVSGATRLVRTMQMIETQKAITAVGMFAMFDAVLQDGFEEDDGFDEAERVLKDAGEEGLAIKFSDLQLAINVLKHGRGRSYDRLVARADKLSFRMKMPGQAFFEEGDVAEARTLIQVDDAFLRECADVIRLVSMAIRKSRPDVLV